MLTLLLLAAMFLVVHRHAVAVQAKCRLRAVEKSAALLPPGLMAQESRLPKSPSVGNSLRCCLMLSAMSAALRSLIGFEAPHGGREVGSGAGEFSPAGKLFGVVRPELNQLVTHDAVADKTRPFTAPWQSFCFGQWSLKLQALGQAVNTVGAAKAARCAPESQSTGASRQPLSYI